MKGSILIEAGRFAEVAKDMTEAVKKVGPNSYKSQ